ncbi:MAG: DUF4412 domain-containing protein [Candidatus Aminicenantes bacterium]|nr:MAG: DUF4412 domain-containing protein [Candidatus Aminicenantes bacterium]
MKKTKKTCFIFMAAVIIYMTGFSCVFGDDHILVESARSYMGHIYPKMITEFWVTDNSVYLKTSRYFTITRYDLKKKWFINPEQKRYYERSTDLHTRADQDTETESNRTIHEVGWEYIPHYDWIVKKPGEKQDINGWECQKVIADGDADYAEKTIEIWMSKDVPVDIKRFNHMTQLENQEWKDIFQNSPELRDFFMVKTKHTIVNAIAPNMYKENKVIKAETADPPQNIYELPEGLEKVKSIEELFSR